MNFKLTLVLENGDSTEVVIYDIALLHKQLTRRGSPDLSKHFNFNGFRHAQGRHFI